MKPFVSVVDGSKEFEGRKLLVIGGGLRIADYKKRGAANQKRNAINHAFDNRVKPLVESIEFFLKINDEAENANDDIQNEMFCQAVNRFNKALEGFQK